MNAGILGTPVPACFYSINETREAGLLMAKIAVGPGGDIALNEDESVKTCVGGEFKTETCAGLPLSPVEHSFKSDRSDISKNLLELLTAGVDTYFGGLFLLIPFLLQIKVWDLAGMLWPFKGKGSKGLTPTQVFLALFFTALGGLKNLNRVRNIQDTGLFLAAGLPKVPSAATLHRYLDSLNEKCLPGVKLKTARLLKRIGLIRGRIINIDIHASEYFGKQALPKGRHGTKRKAVKCWCTMVAHDQDTNNPILHETYLRHLNPFEVLPGFIARIRSVVGGAPWFTLVFDREFFKVEFFAQLTRMPKTKFITLAKNYKTVVEQLEAVPESAFKKLCEGKELAATYLHVTDCPARLRLILIKLLDTGKLIGIITNDEKTQPDMLVLRYARRWRIENFFKDVNALLKLDHLPGIRQPKIDGMFYIKFLVFSMFNYLRQQLGGQFASMNIESMFESLFHKKARLKIENDCLVVRFSYFKGQETIVERYRYLNEKLRYQNIDPRVPWLESLKLEFFRGYPWQYSILFTVIVYSLVSEKFLITYIILSQKLIIPERD